MNWIKYMINISYYMYLGFFLMDCEFYYYTVRFCCCIYWLLIYFRYILALVHVYYMFIYFVGDLVNICDKSLIFNWQPLQNHATYLLTEVKKKVFLTDFIYFLGQNIPFFLNIKSPKQKQKTKQIPQFFFYFSSSNIAKQIFLRICLINSNVNIVFVVHMPLSNLNMNISKYFTHKTTCSKPPPPIIFSSAFLVNFVYFSYSKHHINDIIILCMKKDTFRHEIFRPVI